MGFPERLRMLMAERHETRYRIGKILNVHTTTVTNWLEGKSIPQLVHAQKLAEHYGCSIDELLSDK